METTKKGITGSTIKLIAIASMLIDHISAAVLTRVLISRGVMDLDPNDTKASLVWMADNGALYWLSTVMRLVGRLGFPIFCFLLVEGFQKTRSRAKYAFRLGLFALISEVPFDLATSGTWLEFGYQNVYFTLLLGMLTLWVIYLIMEKELPRPLQVVIYIVGILAPAGYMGLLIKNYVMQILGLLGQSANLNIVAYVAMAVVAVLLLAFWLIFRTKAGSEKAVKVFGCMAVTAVMMFIADNLHTDYSGVGILTIVLMYILRNRRVLSVAAGCIALTVFSIAEAFAFLVLIPISKYNGKRGLKMKYVFYVFYPGHLFILWLICFAMGTGWIPAV